MDREVLDDSSIQGCSLEIVLFGKKMMILILESLSFNAGSWDLTLSMKRSILSQRKELPNPGSNSWFSLPGSYRTCSKGKVPQVPDSLMDRWYEPGRENHEFDPRLGNFFLCVWKKK